MATYTAIDFAGTPITTLKAALAAQSLITATLYEDADCLIISTPLTTKVLKFKIAAAVFAMHYGDAWTSGETVTNEVIYCARVAGTISGLYLIADTAWLFMAMDGTAYQYFGYFGAMDNGDVIAAGFGSTTASTYIANCKAFKVSSGAQILPVGLFSYLTAIDPSGYLIKMPLMWLVAADKKLLMNGAAPAQTLGLYATSYQAGVLGNDLGANYYLTGSSFTQSYGANSTVGGGSLLCEFTP